ncbi:MAG: energy-coupling factor transport system permease protein [Solirubrobacteraceae bacterium]|jgi:energy-coupling factor transport system permease protein|nr:energy-coupling factor transport system permease protein [Solirubrobacteraceae bacterium]
MIYRRRASPLHAARAAAGGAYCLALAACALSFQHPLALGAVAVAALAAAAGAGVVRDVARTARFTLALAALVAVVNVLVVRDGLTVFARLGEVPPLGQVDLTVEALVYGLVLGARVVVVVLCCALFSAAVDPDAVLRLFRRVSLRSALTAALATRLVPVLARDARRMADASACRPRRVARMAVLRAVTASALDRAIDVAATLEVRGYGAAAAARPWRPPWSRHDVAFAVAAVALVALAAGARIAGVAGFAAYPTLTAPVGPAELVLAGALVLVALAPFADRRGIEP